MKWYTIIILIVILFIVIGLFVGTFVIQNKTQPLVESSKLYPFGQIQSSYSSTPSLIRADGSSQLQCPAGSVINIVGAVWQVYDPYGECTESPTAQFKKACQGIPNNPVCDNISSTMFTNNICGPLSTSTYNCRVRNVTEYVGSVCNGLNSCALTMDTNTLGPPPCTGVTSSTTFNMLPTIQTNTSSTFTRGYYLHGIYACVPE